MSNRSNESFFNLLADFVTKSHSEISAFVDLLKFPSTDSVFDAVFSGPADTRATYRFSETGLVFSAETENKRFEIDLPLSPGRAAEATITLTTKGDTPHEATLTGADILDSARIPESFRSLHERLATIIRQVLPEELLKSYSRNGAATQAHQSEARPEPDRDGQAASSTAGASDGAAPYAEYVIERPGEPNLRFKGKLVAGARSSMRGGRQFAYEVFQTAAGTFVGLSWGLSAWPGESTRVRSLVTKDANQLVSLFGHNPVAKAVYRQLGVDTDEVVA